MMSSYAIRPLLENDQSPAALTPRSLLEHPEVRIYAEVWGRADDLGFVSVTSEISRPIGAAWMRQISHGKGSA